MEESNVPATPDVPVTPEDIAVATLNQTLGRLTKMVQNYEIEVANLTAELLRTRAAFHELSNQLDQDA